MRHLIWTSDSRAMRPEGVAGRRSIDAFEQISRHLSRRLSPEHAALFAEPSPDATRHMVDWYAELEPGERAVPLSAAAPEDQAAARATLARLVGEIEGWLTELVARDSSPTTLHLVELTRLALRTPTPDDVLTVGGRPVLVNWGHGPLQGGPGHGILQAIAPSRPQTASAAAEPVANPPPPVRPVAAPAPGPAGTVAAGRTGRPGAIWLALPLWLIFAVLVGVIYRMLVPACGVAGEGWGWWPFVSGCAVAEQQADSLLLALEEETAEARRLDDRLHEARLTQLAGVPNCPPQVVMLPPEPRPAPPPPGMIVEPTIEDEEDVARVTDPPEEATPPPPPGPPPGSDEFDERVRDQDGETSETMITLIWNSDSDLDLWIDCPDGSSISFRNMQACGGSLDIDANNSSIMRNPVENAVLPNRPAPGRYRVRVDNYAGRSSGDQPVPFEVRVLRDGRSETYSGSVAPGAPADVSEFTIP